MPQDTPHPHGNEPAPRVPPPPPLARRLIRYILGFGVSFAIGLAPYLGRLEVPGFTPLLSLIPASIQDTAIPLSAALMGIVAVVIQWQGSERVSQRWLRRWFFRTLLLALFSFIALTVVHTFVVVKVDILGGRDSERFLVGFVRPIKPPCTEDISDSECIKKLTLDVSKIESFWGDKQIRLAKLSLTLPYLLFMSSFGLVVGLLLLKEESSRRHRN
jgi:ABC-type multidrug transport system fused ATPase/permease subunit